MEKISWSPKVRPTKIRQLYENDARGTVDEGLVEDVGLALLHRCQSIRLVTNREVECPRCGAVLTLCKPGSWEPLPGVQTCPAAGCGWETTVEQWHQFWKHRQLLGTAVMQPTETYLRDYPQARSTRERMVCIDQLIHAFHIGLQTGRLNRSFANNLIEGSHDQVVELLDQLSAGPAGVDHEQWRAGVRQMYANRRGQN